MLEDKYTLIYLENKPLVLMEMFHYRCGMVRLKSHGQEIAVSDKERGFLLKMKNGNKPIFKEKGA